MKLSPPPFNLAALELGLPVYQPEKIRDPEAVERIRSLAPDLLVVVAYGQIIPRSVLSIPRLGAINVHASLLPRWGGGGTRGRARTCTTKGSRELGIYLNLWLPRR